MNEVGEEERAVYEHMLNLEEHIVAFREGKNTAVSETVYPPTLAEYSLGKMAETNNYTYGNNSAVRLIEPWGLKFMCNIKQDGVTINYSRVKEYGAVVLKDNGTEINTVEDLLAQPDAFVFSSKNGHMEVDSNGYAAALYTMGIYTYQMDTDFYVAFYVVDDDGCHMGTLKTRNVYDLAASRKDTANDAIERLVYADMQNLCDAITKYRA